MNLPRSSSRPVASPGLNNNSRQRRAGAKPGAAGLLRRNLRSRRHVSAGHTSFARTGLADRVASDARWFPFDFDPRSASVNFVETDWGVLAAQPFLDMRWDLRMARRERAMLTELNGNPALGESVPALNFIWHTGFCCSTLLAHAITARRHNLSLCEPKILADLADVKRTGMFLLDRGLAELPGTALRLLARSAGGTQATIKPAPAANYLLPEAARLSNGKMLFLFSDCRSFVISIARLGDDGWRYVRHMFATLLRSGHLGAEWTGPRLWDLSDLEVAAFVWHLQIDEFLRDWRLLGNDRARSLDCDAFLAAPQETLTRLNEFFGLGLAPKEISAMVAGPLFQRKAKGGHAPFDATQRQAEYHAAAKSLGAELDRCVAWSYETRPGTPRTTPLPAALMPIDKAYLP